MTAQQRRQATSYLLRTFKGSERQACRLLGQARSTQRYQRRARAGEEQLLRRMLKLAGRHPRFGYRRIAALLRREGWTINIKRVRRLWRQTGLCRPLRKKKRFRPATGGGQNSCVARPATRKNDVWTWDFIFDRTVEGGSLKWLTLIDEYTRECLLLQAARSLTASDAVRHLARVVGRRGAPRALRSDNGPEFIGEALRLWLQQHHVQTLYVAPASPWQNGYAEAFHSRLRDEFLERHEFENVLDAHAQAKEWRHQYNSQRPHSALGYRTPSEFATACGLESPASLRSAELSNPPKKNC